MAHKWLSITPEGDVAVLDLPHKPTLEQMQAVVGGLIEPVRLPKRGIIWVNEEGVFLGLPLNKPASMIATLQRGHTCALFGTVLMQVG